VRANIPFIFTAYLTDYLLQTQRRVVDGKSVLERRLYPPAD